MKLAFSSNAYTNYSLSESILDISQIGYDGVEVLCDVPHAFPLPLSEDKISEIKKDLRKNRLEISNINDFTLFRIKDTYNPSWIK